MTVVTDEKNSVPLPSVKPGDRFDLQIINEGKILLTPLSPATIRPASVTITKKDGYTVAILDRPINEQALSEALSKFP